MLIIIYMYIFTLSTDIIMSTDPFLETSIPNKPEQPQSPQPDGEKTTATQEKAVDGEKKTTRRVKKGKTIKASQFFVWCIIFLVIFLLVVSWILFYLSANYAGTSQALNISTKELKWYLQIFAWMILLPWVIIAFGLWIISFVRLLSGRGWRWRNVVWMIVWFFLLLTWSAFWFVSYSQINKIPDLKSVKANGALTAFYAKYSPDQSSNSRIGYDYIPLGWWAKLVWPALIRFSFNKDYIADSVKWSRIAFGDIREYVFSCGNDEERIINATTAHSWSSDSSLIELECFYDKKWSFSPSLKYRTGDSSVDGYEWTFNIAAVVDFMLPDGRAETVSNKIDLWDAPMKVKVNTDNVATAFNVSNKTLQISQYGDGNFDDISGDKTFEYEDAGAYHIAVLLPWDGGIPFTIPLNVRWGASDSCEIRASVSWSSQKVSLDVPFEDEYDGYKIEIINRATDKVVEKFTNEIPSAFSLDSGSYIARLEYVDAFNDKDRCSSDTIKILWELSVQYSADVLYKDDRRPSSIEVDDGKIVLDSYPAIVYIDVETPNTTVYVDGEEEYIDDGVVEVKIRNSRPIEVEFESSRGSDNIEEILKIVSNGPWFEVQLQASPTKWFEPLDVKLDASKIIPIDIAEDVISYERDFGDGEVIEWAGDAIVNHTYWFGKDGIYKPTVTVKTLDGREATASVNIGVKKSARTIALRSPTHPLQSAKVWQTVRLVVEWDGKVDNVKWDFGNGEEWESDGRSWMQATVVYSKPWTYLIDAKVKFDGSTSVRKTLKMEVR